MAWVLTDREPPATLRGVPVDTHWIEYDQVALGGGCKRALCGDVVPERLFSTDPTCAACREEMARIEAMEF